MNKLILLALISLIFSVGPGCKGSVTERNDELNELIETGLERAYQQAYLMASALLELSQYVQEDFSKKYFDFAVNQIQSLTSPAYLADEGTNGNFILKHSTGSKPRNSEVDVPLTYADYILCGGFN